MRLFGVLWHGFAYLMTMKKKVNHLKGKISRATLRLYRLVLTVDLCYLFTANE